jgi:hypothetical protein
MKIYNNSFVNLGPNAGNGAFALSGSGIEIYNNLWYHCEARSFGFAGTHDYNWFYDNRDPRLPNQTDDQALAGAEAHGIVGTGDPFVDWQNGNFCLKAPLGPGKSLASPYNVDRNGLTRGADGVWDRGAFEYSKTNIEYRLTNDEYRMPSYPAPISAVLIYNLRGARTFTIQENQTGIYLAIDGERTRKIIIVK